MSARTAARLAWSLWALSLALFGLGLALLIVSRSSFNFDADIDLFGVPGLACSTVGAIIVSRRPRHPIGWIFCLAGVAFGVWTFARGYAIFALLEEPGSLPGGAMMAWLSAWLPPVGFGLTVTFLLLLFPNGRLPSRRWRPVAWIAVGSVAALVLGTALFPGQLTEAPFFFVGNPFGIEGAEDLLSTAQGFGWLFFVVSTVAAAIAMILRFRHARGEERQQLKWMAYAAALLVLGWVAVQFEDVSQAAKTMANVLIVTAMAGIPLAAGIAILRYRLYDIDRIINRTLVYGLLTGVLGASYFGGVILLQLLSRPVTGGSGLAVAATTLLVAALFQPARRRIQDAVDRRFNRRRYDAAKTIEAFSARLRQQTDLDTLTEELLAVVRETMQPARVSLWLRPAEGRR